MYIGIFFFVVGLFFVARSFYGMRIGKSEEEHIVVAEHDREAPYTA